jgi:hypothetical protein
MFSFLDLMWSHAELHGSHPMFIAAQKNFPGKKKMFTFSSEAKWYNMRMKQKLLFGHRSREEAR